MKRRKEIRAKRLLKQSYLDKARECAVYNDAYGYAFWLDAAKEVSNQISLLTHGEGVTSPSRSIYDYSIIRFKRIPSRGF